MPILYFILCLLLTWSALAFYDNSDSGWALMLVIWTIFLDAIMFAGVISWAINLISYSTQLYIIQSTHKALSRSSNNTAIIEFNSKIIAAKQFHSIWLRNIFISDAYSTLELLPLR